MHDQSAFIRVVGVTKRFGETVAVDNLSLDIGRGELFCLLGGSGCGKTTLLRMLAGFESPTQGRIFIDGSDVTDADPTKRPVNMMFQNYALFPHMSVEANIAYGLKRDGVAKDEIAQRVGEMIATLKLSGFERRKPHQLSGGQRQRVALARALIKRPKVLLLDEPLSALDKNLRQETQYELINIQEQFETTFVVVTHDQEEAMTLASRIAVMDQGQIVQVGEPRALYDQPKNRFIAGFLGTVSFLDGQISDTSGDTARFTLDTEKSGGAELSLMVPKTESSGAVTLALRPERLELTKAEPTATNKIAVTVEDIAFLGDRTDLRVRTDFGALLKVVQSNHDRRGDRFTWEDRAWIGFEPNDVRVVARDD